MRLIFLRSRHLELRISTHLADGSQMTHEHPLGDKRCESLPLTASASGQLASLMIMWPHTHIIDSFHGPTGQNKTTTPRFYSTTSGVSAHATSSHPRVSKFEYSVYKPNLVVLYINIYFKKKRFLAPNLVISLRVWYTLLSSFCWILYPTCPFGNLLPIHLNIILECALYNNVLSIQIYNMLKWERVLSTVIDIYLERKCKSVCSCARERVKELKLHKKMHLWEKQRNGNEVVTIWKLVTGYK